MVRRPPGIKEPNAATFLNLAQIRSAIGAKQKGNFVCAPWATRSGNIVVCLKSFAVTLGLLNGTSGILAFALGLNHGERRETVKQDIISWPCLGWPFGNCDILSLLRADTCGEGQLRRIGFPPRIPQLGIDQPARLFLVKFKITRRLGASQQGLNLICRSSPSLLAQGRQLLFKTFLLREQQLLSLFSKL